MQEFFGKLAALPDAERRFVAGAWLLAPAVELSLAAVGLHRTLSAIERLTSRTARSKSGSVSATRGAELVAASYRRHLVRGECLPRALLQYALHRRAGRDVTLVVGVRPPSSALEAHAWVEDTAAPDAQSRQQGYEPILIRSSEQTRSSARSAA